MKILKKLTGELSALLFSHASMACSNNCLLVIGSQGCGAGA